MTSLAGRRVLITGGAGGVGRAVAERMAASGARVLIADRGELELRGAVESLEQGPARSQPSPPTSRALRGSSECLLASIAGSAGSTSSSPVPGLARVR
jgi:NAD(P)-dependent dehydrogenase (short-subunit alcohol dehydrogenase family)